MNAKQIITLIASLVFFVALVFVVTWVCINFNTVKEGMSGSQLYTQEQVEQIKQETYDKAIEDKNSYLELIGSLRDDKTNLTDELSQANITITNLTNDNKDKETQINTLTTQKTTLENEVINLTEINSNNNETIVNLESDIENYKTQVNDLTLDCNTKADEIIILKGKIETLNSQIKELENSNNSKDEELVLLKAEKSTLQSQVTNLTAEVQSKNNEISTLNNQISSLQILVEQLQETNDLHLNTISSLNAQITTLNSQINDLTLQMQNNSSTVTQLNNRISELEKSVAYYEQYIANLENGEQVVVTFEFDGSVYNMQVVDKGSTVSVITPTSTNYIVFNYWTVDGMQINLDTYTFDTNTKIIADITYKYDVSFNVDNSVINSQIVTKDSFATIPTAPTKTGYEFLGWSLDGSTIIDAAANKITQNTTYFAIFVKLHTVTFIYENVTVSTQKIRNGSFATDVNVENTDYKVFNGWKVNEIIVNLDSYKITSDTTFIADITYKYDVKFMTDNSEYNSQIVTKNTYATTPVNPTKSGYEFLGWSLDGSTIVNAATTLITSNTTFIAVFVKVHNVTFMYEDTTLSTQTIRNGSFATNVTVESTTYKKFNGWKINDSIVTIDNYGIFEDTIFIADITYRYAVKFMVENEEWSSQVITENNYADEPTIEPTKTNYNFVGWSLDGVNIISIADTPITTNTTFIAIFEIQKYTVNFWSQQYFGSLLYTKEVAHGDVIGEIEYDTTKENYTFLGWYVGSTLIDLNTYVVTATTSVYPKYQQSTFTIKFYDGSNLLSSYTIENGATLSSVPEPLGRSNMRFIGYSKNIDYQPATVSTSTKVTSDTTYYAKYEHFFAGVFRSDDYSLTLDYDTGNSTEIDRISGSSEFRLAVIDYSNMTFRSEFGSSQYYIGTYNKTTDSWVITRYLTSGNTELNSITLIRTDHSIGIV